MAVLVTGGTGFIGSHTVRALLDQGEECVLVQRRATGLPPVLADTRVSIERGDVADLPALLDLGTRHKITGIVHLAGSMPWPIGADDPIPAARRALGGLLNIFQVAQEWDVRRVGVASTIGVYHGAPGNGALREDLPLAMRASHVIPTFKKIGELLDDWLAGAAGLDVVNYRISGTWGPGGHEDPFFPAPALVHAAARGTELDLSAQAGTPYAEDSLDLCYVKDTGRAIALLHLADELHHRTYNVASGRATSNADVIAAIKTAVPSADLTLPSRGSATPASWLDITRLHEDTGFVPAYDTERAAADYIAWLRAGNDR
ncbi:NAD-dependent epimerase/dehydratase family protein [Micromonospora krabiensis]|uniref:UDP-glucose 4-epimerase n=1 Tax=Micromonospora krabiensis TaxID=307121 RepID=A0A1C3MZY8_9ACTN|nr:NAD(P)-dependent oxidoreductase [Micromonospora krabiensis]SBV25889.1 UDP-glucose 4-epimerase [Micromonospora krabiensis]